jgi:hypothetical protein
MPDQPSNEQYSPFALLGVVLASLLLFAVFFLGFLVAPLAVLLLFFVGFSAMDRSRRRTKSKDSDDEPGLHGDGDAIPSADERLAREATLRRAERERQTAEAGVMPERPVRQDGE